MSSFWRIMGGELVQDRTEHREGQQAISTLITTVNKHLRGNLLDYGSGKGRLAQFFDPATYLGYDINAYMVEWAQRDSPNYTFTNDLVAAMAFDADCTLLYTVISMWGDDEADRILSRFNSRLIILGEIADKRWANGPSSVPRIYNRDVAQLDKLLAAHGYRRIAHEAIEHERYKEWRNNFDKRMHILVYEKDTRA